jgi:conjugative relaxase-like TrwC/TraI family protein
LQVPPAAKPAPVPAAPPVRFTVTPLGGSRCQLPKVVEGIVRYLQPPPRTTPGPAPGGSGDGRDGPGDYYADSGEEPGRWLGAGAAACGLSGVVDADDFASVLAGRDPRTGERLITAQGSAGRRPDLGAGNHTRSGPGGVALYGEDDAAAALGVTKQEVAGMLDAGTAIALARLVPVTDRERDVPSGVPGGVPGPVNDLVIGSHLVPIVEPDGSRWVIGTELSRCRDDREIGTDPAAVTAAGSPDDQFTFRQAARIAATTTRYLRTVANRWDQERERIEADLAAGRRPRKAYLVAYKNTRKQWVVTRRDLGAFLERRRPPAVRVGYDLTLTTEKSLGVLALLAPPAVGQRVLGAIQTGNDRALGWLESRAAAGRVDGHRVAASGWTVASFRHSTSRALDPFPHHHNVIANTITLPGGTHRALDARALYEHAQAASAIATVEMRHRLTTSLGVRWRAARHGGWEIDGIGNRVNAEFSRRRNEIDDALQELEREIGRGAHPAEVEHIVLASRPAKNRVPAGTLRSAWLHRAAALGFDRNALASCLGHDYVAGVPDRRAFFASLADRDGICAEGSVFTHGDALAALANHPVPAADGTNPQPLIVTAAELEALTDDFLTCDHVVDLDDGRYTTREILDVQERIARRFASSQHRGAHLAPTVAIDDALASRPHLTGEQQALVRAWCGSGSRFQCAIGRAGSGKTTTVAACVDAWEAAGLRVIGVAVKGEAARTLAAATGMRCETVAWHLVQDDPERLPLDARTVLVVDEASTLADRDLDALMTMAIQSGASVRLIGDPAQHGAIAAGGMFRVLCERHRGATPELSESHRVQHPLDRAAADALRDGRIDDALDHLAAAGHLHIVDDDLTMYRQVLGRWWDAHLAGQDHPMVDRRNRTRQQLNRLAHELLRVRGHISPDELTASGGRCFSAGDRITARVPARHLHPPGRPGDYIRNGAIGTITAVHHATRRTDDTLSVEFEGLGEIRVPRAFFDVHTKAGRREVGIDHAYALTSYAVQGSTSPMSTSRLDATASRSEAYVDITRGRRDNHLFLTLTSDPLDGEHLPRLPSPGADKAVADRLTRSESERTAWELRAAGSDVEPPNFRLE